MGVDRSSTGDKAGGRTADACAVANRARRAVLAICAALLAAAVLLVVGCGGDSGEEGKSSTAEPSAGKLAALPATGDLLFVVRGPATVSRGRLTVDTETVDWFTQRPQRRAGVASVSELAKGWGSYGFADDPPNVALAGPNLDTVVELSDPELTGDGIAFDFKALRGELAPSDGEELEELTLFIDDAGASLSCEKAIPENTPACRFQLTQSASFSLESLAQAACWAWNLDSNCGQFTGSATPILVQAWGGGGGKGNTWGFYSGGSAGSPGYAQSVQLYGEVSGDTWYAYVGGGGRHNDDGGSGGMASLVLDQPLSQISSGDISSAIIIAGGGGGGGPANSDGDGWGGGDGGHAWAAGDASSHGGPITTGSNPANAFAPGASTGSTVATSYNSHPFAKGAGCGLNFDGWSEGEGNGWACGGSIEVEYHGGANYSYAAKAGVGGEATSGEDAPPGGDSNIAPVGGNAPDEKMSYSNFVGGTTIDPGLASATLGSGGNGHVGGSGGGGGYGGGGGSGPGYTCGHGFSYALMYCSGAGGGSFAAGSSLADGGAPANWFGSLYTSGTSKVSIWIVSR